MKEHLKPLQDVAKFGGGGTPSKKNDAFWNGTVPWVSPKDMKWETVFDSQDKITHDAIDESAARLVPRNSILIVVRSGILARTVPLAKTGCELTVNQDLKTLQPDSCLNFEYLFYFMRSREDELLAKVTRGATVHRIQTEVLKQLQIPVPPLAEQEAIVAILDRAFAAIDQAKANLEQNIANAQDLFQSKLNQIFSQKGNGWVDHELISISQFIDYRGRTPKKTESGVRLLTAKNVRMGFIKRDPQEYIAHDNFDDWMTRGIPEQGDVLFTTEAPLANVALLDTSEKIALAQRIITICPERTILSGEYLSYCLQSKIVQDRILAKGTGATVTGIKSKLLKQIIVPVANLSIQPEIVAQLDQIKNAIDKAITTYRTKVQSLEELKKSLLQKAFAGELT